MGIILKGDTGYIMMPLSPSNGTIWTTEKSKAFVFPENIAHYYYYTQGDEKHYDTSHKVIKTNRRPSHFEDTRRKIKENGLY